MPRDVINDAQQALGTGEGNLTELLPALIAKILRDRLWEYRKKKDGTPFASFKEFAEYKIWWGLECPYDRLVKYCEHHEACSDLLRRSLVDGKTQQQAADELGVSQQRISQSIDSRHKAKQSERQASRQLYLPQCPKAAAEKIRNKFDSEFVKQLKGEL